MHHVYHDSFGWEVVEVDRRLTYDAANDASGELQQIVCCPLEPVGRGQLDKTRHVAVERRQLFDAAFGGRRVLFVDDITAQSAAEIIVLPTRQHALVSTSPLSGASIPMGQGGHVPPIFGLGGHDHECPPIFLE